MVADPDDGSLAFTIVDVSTAAKELTPTTLVASTTVDLDTARIQDRTGHFAAVGSPLIPANASIGAHEIIWSWTIDSKPYEYVERFDVLAGVPRGLGGGYALVSSFREEEVCEDAATTLRLLKLIKAQSEFIETVTKKWFEPRFMSVRVDGTGKNALLLGHPIIALSTVSVSDEPVAIDFASNELRVYNRHLTGLLDPDDRRSPMIALPHLRWPYELGGSWQGLFSSSPTLRDSFPHHEQNILVEGLFGYTDPDGTHLGKTPEAIRKATMLLVRRELPTLADTEGVFDAQEGHRTKRIKTRDQEVEFDDERLEGVITITGDAAVDRLLSLYLPGLRVGST